MSTDGGRWLLIAASSRGAAEEFATRRGIDAPLILGRRDLLTPPWRLRAEMARAKVDRAAIHSRDWGRERAPQLAEFALGIAPVERRELIDEGAGATLQTHRWLAPATVLRLPLETLAAMILAGVDAGRLATSLNGRPATRRDDARPRRVLAIWPGSSNSVGGAVTHMSGVMTAFRRANVHVSLASAGAVPRQLAAAADAVEVAKPVPRRARLAGESEQLAVNRTLYTAALRLAAEAPPDVVYQRHRAFLGVGTRLSHRLRIPFVLEWNGSEAWMRRNWDAVAVRIDPVEGFVKLVERRVVGTATLIVAISKRAAEMAAVAGADDKRVLVVPNGVDLGEVNAALEKATDRRASGRFLVGWIGSFGPWHGAEVFVRAAAHLPADMGLRMIGQGPGRAAAQALARELGVFDRIEWSGAMPHPAALVALAECDALVSPHVPASDVPFFGSPTKIFEYMALGRPIVASRLEQIEEVLEHERTALLVEPGDERALAAAIVRVARLPDAGRSLGLAAAQEAKDSHSWDKRVEAILAALEPAV